MSKKSISTIKHLQECPLCLVHQGVQQFLVIPPLLFHHLLQQVPGLQGLPKTVKKSKKTLSQPAATELLVHKKREFWIFEFGKKHTKTDVNLISQIQIKV